MAKAFIFDLDGVLIDDEIIWDVHKRELYIRLFGEMVAKAMDSTVGLSMEAIYEKAVECGGGTTKQSFIDEFYKLGDNIYATAPIPDGLSELVDVLKEYNYRIGIVSASPMAWITIVTKRLAFQDDIELILSLHERPDLNHKPEPDGYKVAIKALGSDPKNTLILEDSNSGIASGKAAGAFTIGYTGNLMKAYKQEGADAYANTMEEVAQLVRGR